MTITAYRIIIDQNIGDYDVIKSLTYRGNENIIIEQSNHEFDDSGNMKILFPRHILEAFLDMVKI